MIRDNHLVDNDKWSKALYDEYKELGIKDVSITLYKDDRHEMFNETNKEEVFNNILSCLNKHK